VNYTPLLTSYFLKYRFNADRKFSQNFIIDKNAIEKFVSTANVKDKVILEIGPGTGFITKELLIQDAKKVICIEIDNKLVALLKDVFSKEIKSGKLIIINTDVLKSDLNELVKKEKIDKIVSSAPYNISSDLIYKVLPLEISEAIFIFQQDFLFKLENDKFYSPSAISVISNYYAEPLCLDIIGPKAFLPTPKINSQILKLKYRKKRLLEKKEEELFVSFIKEIFRFSSKGLRKAIMQAAKNIKSKGFAKKLLRFTEFDSKYLDVKVTEISSKEYVKIFLDIIE